MQNLISFDDQTKQTNLFLSGWMNDTPNYDAATKVWSTEPTANNEGMKARCGWFREGCRDDVTKPYSKTGAIFVSLLRHEFSGIRTVFPPATKIQFTLSKAADEWYLMRGDAADKTQYKFHIISCCLFIKVVTLSDPIYRGLKARMDSNEKLLFHYRRYYHFKRTINVCNLSEN